MKKVLAAALAATALACVGNNASVQLQAVCFPTDDCTFASTCDAQFIGLATLDVSLSSTYVAFVQVANQLQDNADAATGRTNTNDARIHEFRIEYDAPAGWMQDVTYRAGPYQVPAEGTAVIGLTPIPAAIGASLPPVVPDQAVGTDPLVTVIAKVRARGEYDNGSTFETGVFEMPIRICDGCLASRSFCSDGTPTAVCPSDGQSPFTQTDCQ